MKRFCAIFANVLLPLLSAAVLVTAGWLWHRSYHMSDYYCRLEPVVGGSALRGVGSYRGAMLFGTVFDPCRMESASCYRHEAFALSGGGGPSMIRTRPTLLVHGLGFGVSRGELTFQFPLAFLMLTPSRTYRVIYVPYYFIMLLALIAPARLGWRACRGMSRSVGSALRIAAVGEPDGPRCGPYVPTSE